jgi:hypothetical protein
MSTATLDPGLTTGDADTAANALAHLNLDELSGPFVSYCSRFQFTLVVAFE